MADEPTPDPDPAPEEGKTFTQADLDKKVQERLARERSKYADYDELKAKASKLDEQEAANKSDLEQANEKLVAAEKRAADAESRADRLEIVVSKAFDEETSKKVATAAKRLTGTTREEIEADADEFLPSFSITGGVGGTPPPPTNRPSPDLKGGSDPTDAPVETDPAKLAATVPRR